MKAFITTLLIAFTIPLQAQEHQNGIGLNFGYSGEYGLEGTLSYEKFVGLRHLIRASAGLRSRNAYTLGIAYQYALVNSKTFQLLTGLSIDGLSTSGRLLGTEDRINRIFTSLPIDVRYRISDKIWINAGISTELGTLSGSKPISSEYDFILRLGCVYRF